MMNGRTESYHQPVLVGEVVEYLATNPVGAYLDLTVGGGGHLKALGCALDEKARLYGADKDSHAVAHATEVLQGMEQQGRIIKASFGDLSSFTAKLPETVFDGILLDLGLSSRQIDDPSRGFSFQADGPLDMRFDQSVQVSAADLVNEAGNEQLVDIIRDFGEERKARHIVRAIVDARSKAPIKTTAQLANIVRSVVKGPYETKSLARVFQAIRIAVNHELDELKRILPSAVDCLVPGGRLAVISYHSLEDRHVKWYFRERSRSADSSPYAMPGDRTEIPVIKLITKKPVLASPEEIAANSRARSAKLRVAEKI